MSAPEPAPPRRAVIVGGPAAIEDASASGAEVLVVAVAPPGGIIADLRARRPGLAIYAALTGPDDPALDGFMAERPDGVLLRDARSGRDVAALGGRLAVCEALVGLPDGTTVILAAIGHSLGVLDARSFAGASSRLAGLALDETALAAAPQDKDALAQARGLIRLAAAAAGVSVFEVLTTGEEPSSEGVAAARPDGFESLAPPGPARVAAGPREGGGPGAG